MTIDVILRRSTEGGREDTLSNVPKLCGHLCSKRSMLETSVAASSGGRNSITRTFVNRDVITMSD